MKRFAAAVIGVVICVVLIVQVLMPTIDEDSSGLNDAPAWQYDDYRPASEMGDVTAAAGALELIDVEGTGWIHASGVGEGTITYADGSSRTVNVEKAILDVFLMTGQSNAAYHTADVNAAYPRPALGTAYYFGTETGMPHINDSGVSYSMLSMDKANGTLRIGDKGPAFASTYNEATGHKIYWICTGISGMSITTFQPAGGSSWGFMKTIVEKAIAAVNTDLYDVNTLYYMWIQGEADANMAVDTYKEYFLTMHDAIISGELGHTFSVCFMSKVRAADGANPSEAQMQLAQEHPDTIIMATTITDTFNIENGLMSSDNLHYSQRGDNLVAIALAESILRYEAGPDPYEDIRPLINVIPLILVASIILIVGMAIIRRGF